MTANDIVSRVRDILLDTELPYRNSDAELLRWLSDGQLAIVAAMPEAYTVSRPMQLQAGSYRQSIPADALRLMDVPRNLGANGSTPGPVIRLVGRNVLDGISPMWTAVQGSAVEHYVYDYKAPRTFMVYPPPATALYVEVVVSVRPPGVSGIGDALSLDDNFFTPLVDYAVFRALSKDVDSQTNTAKAAAHYGLFNDALKALAAAQAGRAPASQKGGATE